MEGFLKDCRRQGISVLTGGFDDYLRDESRFTGFASGIVHARTEQDIIGLVRAANTWDVPLTVVSGKTSLTGASVPQCGVILDVKGLDQPDPDDVRTVGPGIIVKRYRDLVDGEGLFYPPDPTSEESCTIGGNVACNASGALSYLYGPTRDYIDGFKLLLPQGAVLEIQRGDVVSHGERFVVPRGLFSPQPAHDLEAPVPRTGTPDWKTCKNAAGLFSSNPMDLVDLFIGSEGILGVFLRIKTILLPRRRPFFALMLSLPTRELTVAVVTLLDGLKRLFHDKERPRESEVRAEFERLAIGEGSAQPDRYKLIAPSCMEWFGASVAPFVSQSERRLLDQSYGTLYVEQEYSEQEGLIEAASQWDRLVETINRSIPEQGRKIRVEAALDAKQIRRMRDDRKAVPERVNESIEPGMVKVALDFAVPMPRLGEMMKLYEDSLRDRQTFTYGHIGNAHLHVNLMPRSPEELEQSRHLYLDLARKICAMGGSVSAEHGIGKLKPEVLEIMLGPHGIEEIRKVKRALDPKWILNRGNMIGPG
jgi:D-lactate dehydrogenase (cytochrome)